MFARRRETVIAEGLKIIGSVTAEGLVEVNGQIEGDLHCTSLIVSPKACINGGVQAERVVVNGKVEGPIHGGEVILKSRAIVVGDIQTQSLTIERGAHFEGRSVRANGLNMPRAEKVDTKPRRTASAPDVSIRKETSVPPESAGDIKPAVKHVA
jgi:cytoskeletal protein CcmA (bactofilin family)